VGVHDEVTFFFVEGGVRFGNLVSVVLTHLNRDVLISRAVEERDRYVDIRASEAPLSEERSGVPVGTV